MCACQTVVMTPKGGGTDFRGIGLVEVLWKAISGIINRQIPSSIQFHDSLHGFYTGRGTGTSTLEAKLLQKIIVMRDAVLHSIFPDLRKAYDALDRDRCLYILAGYGMDPGRSAYCGHTGPGSRWQQRRGDIMVPFSRATAG